MEPEPPPLPEPSEGSPDGAPSNEGYTGPVFPTPKSRENRMIAGILIGAAVGTLGFILFVNGTCAGATTHSMCGLLYFYTPIGTVLGSVIGGFVGRFTA